MTAHTTIGHINNKRRDRHRNISSTTTTESPEVVRKLEMMNKNFVKMMRQIQTIKSVDTKCETCGGPHSFTECPAADGYTQEAAYAITGQRGITFNQGNNNYQAPNFQAPNYQAQVGPSNELTNYIKSNEATLRAMQTHMTNMKTELRNEFKSMIDARTNKIENQNNQIMNILTNMQNQNSSSSGSLPSNTVANPRGDVKAITTRSGVAYNGPTIPPTPSPLPKEVERETEVTKDKSTLPTKGMRSIISTVSISLKDFLPSILLLMVIIVAVVIVTVIWVVIFVNVIVGVIIVVAIIGVVVVVGVPSIIDLSFVIIGNLLACSNSNRLACASTRIKASSVKVPVAKVYFDFPQTHLSIVRKLILFIQTANKAYSSFRTIISRKHLLMAALCASTAVVRLGNHLSMASKVMLVYGCLTSLLGAILINYKKNMYKKDITVRKTEIMIQMMEMMMEERDKLETISSVLYFALFLSMIILSYRPSSSLDEGEDRVHLNENTGGIILSVEFFEELKELLPDEAGK
ncbi:hypothetical protein Tco_0634793 [Tanacetum coccineum]